MQVHVFQQSQFKNSAFYSHDNNYCKSRKHATQLVLLLIVECIYLGFIYNGCQPMSDAVCQFLAAR